MRQGLVDADSKVADMLRRAKKPVILAVNKVDNFDKFMPDVYEFYNLGIGDPNPVSASSRLGIGDLLDAVVAYFPEKTKKRRRTKDRGLPLSENQMSENPPSSINFSGRTVSLYRILQGQHGMLLIRRLFITEKSMYSLIQQVFAERARSRKSWNGTVLSGP